MSSIFGDLFKVITFGESHGKGLGAVVEGCPSGLDFDEEVFKTDLSRRRPGQSEVVTSRNEADIPVILSGVFEGKTLGSPIAVVIENLDHRSSDYNKIKQDPRPGHADDVWQAKYKHVDHRGGGRSSGRETVARVIAGSIAKMLVKKLSPKTEVLVFTSQIGELKIPDSQIFDLAKTLTSDQIYDSKVRMPTTELSKKAEDLLKSAKANGESFGGISQVIIKNPPSNLGEPVFDKFKAQLAKAYLSIGAVNGFEFGRGFDSAMIKGTDFHSDKPHNYGGIRGGLTTGEDVFAKVSFKPTSSVLDVAKKGRHDPCIVPRAVSVVESMTYLVLADCILKHHRENLF